MPSHLCSLPLQVFSQSTTVRSPSMLFGAFTGVLFVNIMQTSGSFSKEGAFPLLILTMIFSALCGAVFSLLLSFAAVNLKSNQTVSGTALNMLAPALVLFLTNIISNQKTVKKRHLRVQTLA